jgi:hypothetical protein
MSERENGQLTLVKRTVRNGIAPDVLGAIKTLNRKETSHAVIPPEIGRRRERLSLDDFSGTWGLQSRSHQCDTVVRFARAAR